VAVAAVGIDDAILLTHAPGGENGMTNTGLLRFVLVRFLLPMTQTTDQES
jgi:hypothetical protein